MSRAKPPAQVIRHPADIDDARGRHRIHLGFAWREHHVHTEPGAHLQIGVKGSRIAVEIVFPVELKRIHENTDDDEAALNACALDETGVSGVERSHRRHEAYDASGTPSAGCPLSKL
jgi:hypothetical protein